MMKAIKTALAILAAITVVGLCLSCSSSNSAKTDKPQPQQTADNTSGANAGLPDPNAVQFTAVDIDGASHLSTEWVTRQPVVLNFWGTWCGPCRREIPDLVKFYDTYKPQGVEIVSLAVNDEPAAVKMFTQRAGMKWVMLMGSDEIYKKYGGIRGVPTTIFIDRNGREVQRFVGATSYEDFSRAAQMIL